jgi:hypothetical protein
MTLKLSPQQLFFRRFHPLSGPTRPPLLRSPACTPTLPVNCGRLALVHHHCMCQTQQQHHQLAHAKPPTRHTRLGLAAQATTHTQKGYIRWERASQRSALNKPPPSCDFLKMNAAWACAHLLPLPPHLLHPLIRSELASALSHFPSTAAPPKQ